MDEMVDRLLDILADKLTERLSAGHKELYTAKELAERYGVSCATIRNKMITIARNEDTVTTQVGVKGDVAYNENANESGTITVTLMGTSSSLPYVRSLALKRKEVSVMIVDDRKGQHRWHGNQAGCLLRCQQADRGRV